MDKVTEGRITISRIQGRDLPANEVVRITLVDDVSTLHAVEVSMSLESFAECVLGLGHSHCTFKFNNSVFVGTSVGESKTEVVPTKAYSLTPKQVDAALVPFEVDGWRARVEDMTNHHCTVRNKDGSYGQKVVFFRNVPKLKSGE